MSDLQRRADKVSSHWQKSEYYFLQIVVVLRCCMWVRTCLTKDNIILRVVSENSLAVLFGFHFLNTVMCNEHSCLVRGMRQGVPTITHCTLYPIPPPPPIIGFVVSWSFVATIMSIDSCVHVKNIQSHVKPKHWCRINFCFHLCLPISCQITEFNTFIPYCHTSGRVWGQEIEGETYEPWWREWSKFVKCDYYFFLLNSSLFGS